MRGTKTMYRRTAKIRELKRATTRNGRFLLLSTVFSLSFIAALLGTAFAFFSDSSGSFATATSGNLHIGATLKINDTPGSLIHSPEITTSDASDPRCDNMNCYGQNQGSTGLRIQPNTIQSFSYTLANTGTTNYTNYTGDRIAAWIESEYMPPEDPTTPFVSLLPNGDGIVFDGTNYIDTGIMTSNNLTVQVDAQQDCGGLLNLGAANYLVGANANNNSNYYIYSTTTGLSCLLSAQTWHAGLGTQTLNSSVSLNLLTSGDPATFMLTTNPVGGQLIINNQSAASTTGTLITTPESIYLGARNNNGIANGNFSGTISALVAASSTTGELLANYQPAARCNPSSSTMVFGFWDTVSQTFITQTAGNAFSQSVSTPYAQACANIVYTEPVAPIPNPMQILLYPASISDSTIDTELSAMLAGSTTTSPSAIASLNGSSCTSSFPGTDAGISPVCMTDVLTAARTGTDDTLGKQTAIKASQTYNYKFVVYLPSNTPPSYENIIINFGVSSGARGDVALNWREQIHPYISAMTTGGSNPDLSVIGNTQPFLDQVANDSASKQNYLQSIIAGTDKKLGTCSFTVGSPCEMSIANDGGFDPSKVGTYNVVYSAINNYGNAVTLVVPIEVWNFKRIANGMYHGIALGTNGSVWTWGYNIDGQRGQGNTTSAASLPAVTRIDQGHLGGLPAIDIAGSYNSSCAINSAGTAYCWGNYLDGALGNGGETGDGTAPSSVIMPDGVTFSQIDGSTGSDASYDVQFAAIGSDGNVYTWGSGTSYRTGTGSTADTLVPTRITNSTGTPFVQVDVGATGGAAVTSAGQVYVWGMNNQGQMAYGNTTATNATTSLPHPVSGLSNVKQVSYGGYASNGFVMALKTDGTVWNWGWGVYGLLGNNSTATQPTPVQATVTNVRDIEAGADRGMYVVGNDIWGAGYNDNNETFTQDISPRTTPTLSTMANIAGNVGMITEGYNNAWVLSKDGKKVWGIGYSTLSGQEFGNPDRYTSSFDEAIPWAFEPEPVP